MVIGDVLKGVKIEKKYNYNAMLNIEGITTNSKLIKNNNMYVCICGEKFDTHNLMQNLEKNIDVFIVEKYDNKITKTQIVVNNTRKILLKLLLNFNYGIENKIKLIGVTGTNGKTTITFYTKFILEKLNCEVAVLGTNGCIYKDVTIRTNNTTPTPEELVGLLKTLVKLGAKFLVMEISAHAVKQYRVYGLKFQIGCITNITQDHLDDFSSMYEYAYYKLLFIKKCATKIINLDDEFCATFNKVNSCFTISKEKISDAHFSFCEKFIKINIGNKFYKIKNYNYTTYNIFNFVCAFSICCNLGLNMNMFQNFQIKLSEVDGRFNALNYGNYHICIDFAHTPDALEKILTDLKSRYKKVITVFGASGFRDSIKRHKMGQIASKYSDYIILTADNPRHEKCSQICEDISNGITLTPYVFIPNREKAIEHALECTTRDCVIAILGKGNEEIQDINAIEIAYSDMSTCKKMLKIKGVLNE